MQLRFLYCIVYFERQLNESKYVNDIYAKSISLHVVNLIFLYALNS